MSMLHLRNEGNIKLLCLKLLQGIKRNKNKIKEKLGKN